MFQPSLQRYLIASMVAFIGFWLPQEVPLEWYPLDNPGNEILYLEFKCLSTASGEVRIVYATAGEFASVNVIRWPIAPTKNSYTYTFPLPDAPITAIRLETLGHGGALRFDDMKLSTRGGREIHRFASSDFVTRDQTELIVNPDTSWSIRAKADAQNPVVGINLPVPVIAKGANLRNLARCILSTGYLTMMLSIGLLAVLFATYRTSRAGDLFTRIGFVLVLAGLFALVANRGLIRNSFRYATFTRAHFSTQSTSYLDQPGTNGLSFGRRSQFCLSRDRKNSLYRHHA